MGTSRLVGFCGSISPLLMLINLQDGSKKLNSLIRFSLIKIYTLRCEKRGYLRRDCAKLSIGSAGK
ncbi:MAG: hypothetical protein A3F14_01260 [Gammaproteobacteria bacterium RIFCSPHIGHO2_12_FULL_43_28]|nr:MAG: hypothetical protein A3F14_01260 [Gammaproteobacteria bacterium RIFCSPHIGHO2_12_FULL_43_28]